MFPEPATEREKLSALIVPELVKSPEPAKATLFQCLDKEP